MANKIAVMLDGGHVRVHARKAGKTYDPAYIEKLGLACALTGETIHRIMYYDCAPSLVSGSKSLVFSGLQNSPKSPWKCERPDPCKMGLRVSRGKMSKV